MGELFAGIGGFSLGFRRAGFEVVWQVEIEPYCRKVLEKNFPEAERFNDVREVGKHNLQPVDVICGGFPCQDISYAGKGAGIEGSRSGLWSEFARIISELRPRFAVVENVPALLTRGLGRVLGDLAEIGYDAEWRVISAADMGAPHRRERVWILTYPQANSSRANANIAGLHRAPVHKQGNAELRDEQECESRQMGEAMAYSDQQGEPALPINGNARDSLPQRASSAGWDAEPNVGRVANGVPNRVDRLRALGNAVVPQMPEWIARRILEAA